MYLIHPNTDRSAAKQTPPSLRAAGGRPAPRRRDCRRSLDHGHRGLEGAHSEVFVQMATPFATCRTPVR